MKIEIYGTPTCKFCDAAKNLCKANNLEYTYIDLTPQNVRDAFKDKTGVVPRTAPQIVVNDILVGSFDAFNAYLTNQV